MTSRLAQKYMNTVVVKERSKGSAFYQEVVRALPFIQRLHRLEELISTRDLQAIVKAKFYELKDVKDPRVLDILIFKGREELETYLMMHKQKHHAITEYIEPYFSRRDTVKQVSAGSAFLDDFLTSGFATLTNKTHL